MFLMIFGEAIETVISAARERRHRPAGTVRRPWFAPGQLHLIAVSVAFLAVRHLYPEMAYFVIWGTLFLGCLVGPEVTVWILCGEEVARNGSAGSRPPE